MGLPTISFLRLLESHRLFGRTKVPSQFGIWGQIVTLQVFLTDQLPLIL
jgi:hypothetical protein